jgi:hypothetical protein
MVSVWRAQGFAAFRIWSLGSRLGVLGLWFSRNSRVHDVCVPERERGGGGGGREGGREGEREREREREERRCCEPQVSSHLNELVMPLDLKR